ncbi:divergent polysaccharide deacetylase family protein [Desulfotomaculum varum]
MTVFLVSIIMAVSLLLGARQYFTVKPVIKQTHPVLAIVIDDFGGPDSTGVTEFMSFNRPITAAVMPNLINSTAHATEAHRRGHEVIMHQPMEPLHGKASWLGPGAILSHMSEVEIKRTFEQNLNTVPYAIGFNNHTGSKITASKAKIAPMLEVARQKGLFVLDSGTSYKSQIIPVAQSMHVPWVKRDVFLDDVKSRQHIAKQIKKACQVAKRQGYAVVIGHVGQGGNITAQGVKQSITYIEREGIKLVPLSEVVKLNNRKEQV